MLTLLLLRHAKSSWHNIGADDFDRSLTQRGQEAAPVMGRVIADRDLVPQLIMCSSATRTRETLHLILPEFAGASSDKNLAITFDDQLYLASASLLLTQVRRIPVNWRRVMVVGHNPGLHDLAAMLAGSGNQDELANLSVKFPTCALAVINFAAQSWSSIEPKSGTLICFTTPRREQRNSKVI